MNRPEAATAHLTDILPVDQPWQTGWAAYAGATAADGGRPAGQWAQGMTAGTHMTGGTQRGTCGAAAAHNWQTPRAGGTTQAPARNWFDDPAISTPMEPAQWVIPEEVITPTPDHTLPRRRVKVRSWPQLVAGVTLAAISLLAVGKVIWEQWGSNLVASRNQARLAASPFVFYNPTLEEVAEAVTEGEEVAEEVRISGPPAGYERGDKIATIRIPSADIEWQVVAGADTESLKLGPGWMIGTSFPGDPGNAAIAGHRTTYGAPFNRLDELSVGDRIIVSFPDRPDAVYEVRASMVLKPEDVWVAHQTDGARLTLTTCHPEGSAKERYVIQAELVEGLWADKALPADQWQPSQPPAA